MNGRFIKFWSEWTEPDNRIWANPDLLKLWIWCLHKANYRDKRWVSLKSGKGRVDIEVRKGQFAFGRKSAADELGINPNTIRARIEKLERLGFLSINSTSQYSIITICDYEYYQGIDSLGTPTNEGAIRQANSEPNNTTKNIKNIKKDKNKTKNNNPPIIPPGGDVLEGFEEFWKAFPNKKAKQEARKAWKQVFHNPKSEFYFGAMTPDLIQTILDAISAQVEERRWRAEARLMTPPWTHPSTWLRGHRWEDGVEEEENPYANVCMDLE